MNYPPPVLLDTWLKLSNMYKPYYYDEAIELARDRIFTYFETIREAEMYLYRTGYYGDE